MNIVIFQSWYNKYNIRYWRNASKHDRWSSWWRCTIPRMLNRYDVIQPWHLRSILVHLVLNNTSSIENITCLSSVCCYNYSDCWILDALRRSPHPSHTHLSQSLEWIEQAAVKSAVLTNMHIDLDYDTLCNELLHQMINKHACVNISKNMEVDSAMRTYSNLRLHARAGQFVQGYNRSTGPCRRARAHF